MELTQQKLCIQHAQDQECLVEQDFKTSIYNLYIQSFFHCKYYILHLRYAVIL